MREHWVIELRTAGSDTWSVHLDWSCRRFRSEERYPTVYDSLELADAAALDRSRSWVQARARRLAPQEWRWRELCRTEQGDVEAPVWDAEPWWNDRHGMAVRGDHFPYVARIDAGKIAFTEDEAKGAANRQTVIKPGKFLKRFFGDALTDEAISAWASRQASMSDPGQLFFATTPDEIEEVYTTGPSSCMSKPASHYSSSEHPVRVYGAGDLAIAYVKRAGRITARAVCWPEKKRAGRLYGDEHRLGVLLSEAGYAPGILCGARLLRIADGDALVCPYIDGDSTVEDHGTHLTIGGNLSACSTDGLITIGDICAHCGDTYDSDSDGGFVYDRDEHWCGLCLRRHAVYLEREDIMVSEDRAIQLCSGEYASDDYFNEHGWTCYETGYKFLIEDDTPITLADGLDVCDWWFDRHGFICGVTGECHRNEDGVLHPHLGMIHKDTDEAVALAAAENEEDTSAPELA